jgi:fermentation-respiration switch protein FrsA (DUF1100 family)
MQGRVWMSLKVARTIKVALGLSAVVVSGLYILLAPIVATPLYDKLLFYPDYPVRYDEKEYQLQTLHGCTKQDLHIETPNGQTVHAWFFRNPHASKVVLVSHGNASNISNRKALADDLLQLGVSVLLYDYRGFGLSEGEPSIPNICEDGLSAFDYLCAQQHYAPKDIILFGESLGCAVSCRISSKRKCDGLILQSGFSSLRAISGEKFAFLQAYPDVLYPAPALDSLAILKTKTVPVLFIHGEQDETIPCAHSKLMFASVKEPKQLLLLPNSGHFIAEEDHDQFMNSLRTCLASLGASKIKK